jgi:predicted SprT family Zn-dependent metalloprotease
MNFARKISQLIFDFQAPPPWKPADGPVFDPSLPKEKPTKRDEKSKDLVPDEALAETCRELLIQIGLSGMAKVVQVNWNPRLRSTAGYASYPSWRIELNPRLREFEGQTERTLKHELAHLVAYHRAGRRRIEPHGVEWKTACSDLGIPGESARHTLPLPRREVKRNYTYACAHCGLTTHRVRKFRRHTACSECCKKHNGGQYDAKYRFVLIDKADPAK